MEDSQPPGFITSISVVFSSLQSAWPALAHVLLRQFPPPVPGRAEGAWQVGAASLTYVFTGPGAVYVFPEQGLPQNHLPQLAARLQRGADHVLLAGGMHRGREM